jgi:catechol 2,3-dioxygenase-like lactoylglutathione lyase family enzyme
MIRVNDLEESIKFYTEILGMTLNKKTDYESGKFTLANGNVSLLGDITAGSNITGATITGSTFKLVGVASWADLSIQQGPYTSPSITWGPVASPSFSIYQFAGGGGSVIRVEDAGNTLFIQSAGTLEFAGAEIKSPYTDIQMPSAPTDLSYFARRGFRNIYAETSLPNVNNFYDGDIVLVY